MKNKSKIVSIMFCIIIMFITAASDALKGVFLPEFKKAFLLTDSQSSKIIMMSYIGNLIFLFVGGYLSDRMPRRRFLGSIMMLWMSALVLYVFTENYYVLLIAMIFSMGCSTMISTSINMITPLLFASPVLLVNIFNFCQGVGLTASQNIGGRFADSMTSWHIANGIILTLAVVCFVILMTLKLPNPQSVEGSALKSYAMILKNPASYILIIICGFYYIAEHGLQNWLTSYGSEYLGFTVSKSAFFLSLFFGGITVGRLIFAPLVQKIGIFRTMLIWSLAAAVLYAIGIFMERRGVYIVGISGLAFSVLYPTFVLMIGKYYDKSIAGTATGFVLSIAAIFDVIFNAFFGSLIEAQGYGLSIKLLPAAMIMFAAMIYLLRFGFKKLIVNED